MLRSSNATTELYPPFFEFTERRVALADELHVVRNVGSIRYPGGAARRGAQRIVFPVAHQERRHCIERTIHHAGDKLLLFSKCFHAKLYYVLRELRDKFNRCSGVAFQDSSNGTAKSASTFASVSRFSTMSQRIKSNNEAGAAAAGDAATGRKGSQSSTVRENTVQL